MALATYMAARPGLRRLDTRDVHLVRGGADGSKFNIGNETTAP